MALSASLTGAASEPKNPGGNMGMGAIIYENGSVIESYSDYIKADYLNSNNVAEYLSFLWLLRTLKDGNLQTHKIKIFGDSMLVIRQMKGDWKMKSGRYIEYAHIGKKLLAEFSDVVLQWIPRDQNSYADELSKGQLISHNVQFKIQPNP